MEATFSVQTLKERKRPMKTRSLGWNANEVQLFIPAPCLVLEGTATKLEVSGESDDRGKAGINLRH